MTQEHSSREAFLKVADAIGGLMEFWGFKRNMGRMWTVLYLSAEALPAAELADRLSLSTGAVSMTLAELSKWGVVRKTWRPGDRKDYYEPETSIWKMVSRVFREREMRQIDVALEAFEKARLAVQEERRAASKSDRDSLDFALARINTLLEMARLGHRILSGMLSGQAMDALPLKQFDDK